MNPWNARFKKIDPPLNEKEIKLGFEIWRQSFEPAKSEKLLTPFLNENIKAIEEGHKEWLKLCRQGMRITTTTVAKNLYISTAAYSRLERAESTGKITMASLEKAAAAMDCELIYAIRPKQKKLFSEIHWPSIYAAIKNHPWLRACDQKRRGHALGYRAKVTSSNPQFKKLRHWSQRPNQNTQLGHRIIKGY